MIPYFIPWLPYGVQISKDVFFKEVLEDILLYVTKNLTDKVDTVNMLKILMAGVDFRMEVFILLKMLILTHQLIPSIKKREHFVCGLNKKSHLS